MSKCQYSCKKAVLIEIRDVEMSIFLWENFTFRDTKRRDVNMPVGIQYFLRYQMSKCQYSYRKTILVETTDVEMSIFLWEYYTFLTFQTCQSIVILKKYYILTPGISTNIILYKNISFPPPHTHIYIYIYIYYVFQIIHLLFNLFVCCCFNVSNFYMLSYFYIIGCSNFPICVHVCFYKFPILVFAIFPIFHFVQIFQQLLPAHESLCPCCPMRAAKPNFSQI